MVSIVGITECGTQKCPLLEITFAGDVNGHGKCIVQIRKKSKNIFAIWICTHGGKIQKVIDEKITRLQLQAGFEQGFLRIHENTIHGFSEGRARARLRRMLGAV
ncbi:hypothetical protein AUJ77_00905 [Candidatus Nomurabacteria bacterium CG1_02_43_90]|uniref:Uncharacterized protein n=1 Tax=Candidatus Nomurabacteria bacterium CG1_02_43_90 TaxID=1805281 RepID=A0A1J4V8C8_9BACT|nr:MAG: hypothetical protein AUJ77_00905 [Candidatus Nomurabacteria bacterium CG1_02_43_90]